MHSPGRNRENFFSFSWSGTRLEGKTWKKLSSSRAIEGPKRTDVWAENGLSFKRGRGFLAMMERRQIVRLWQQGGAAVLVTLVRAEGSSYRHPGARLLLGIGGQYAGTISGGCLEAEVVRKACWLVREGAVVERYSTMFDDTA